MTHRILIALGSNYLQAAHLQWAVQRLSQFVTEMHLSRSLWTPDIKGSGMMYMNQLVMGTTTLSAAALEQELKTSEKATGRTKQQVTIDLDLMRYDDERFHLRDWPRPYIQQLIDDVL
jgi:2-amino-4-hydroxy-6-hydroxymethyldihydropteridine diphosphokinase